MPRKNVKPFQGHPLVAHSIRYAQSAPSVTAVFVSTDDGEIAQISQEYGAQVIDRPPELSGDTATTESAITHALDVWQADPGMPDIIILLQATSPLRPQGSLEDALSHFTQGGFDSLLSLSPTHRFFWRIAGDQAQAEYDFQHRPRRQDMSSEDIRYVENGSVYIFTRAHFQKTGNRLGGKIGYTIFPEEYAPEIDTLNDFITLEQIANDLLAAPATDQ